VLGTIIALVMINTTLEGTEPPFGGLEGLGHFVRWAGLVTAFSIVGLIFLLERFGFDDVDLLDEEDEKGDG